MQNLNSLTPQDVTAIATLVIALLAFGVTIWQTAVGRKHNRLSVRPKLDWTVHRTLDPERISLEIWLLNKGIGPALITDATFLVDGETFSPNIYGDAPVEIMNALGLADRRVWASQHGMPGSESVLSAGERMLIATFQFIDRDPHVRLYEIAQLERADMKILYQDLYGCRFEFFTRNAPHTVGG